MAANSTTHVVILGAAYAGTGLAHKLLESPDIKVTLINPSETFYFNLASPRFLAKPSQNPLEKVLLPIAKAFTKYPATRFEFVVDSATSVDVSGKSVTVGSGKSFSYDYLVIATGSTTAESVKADGIPFKSTNSKNLASAVEKAQQRIAAASSIIIAGGGPVGVETAGEIAEAYPKTKVTLVTGGERLLDFMKPSASKAAEGNLKGLGVDVQTLVKVLDAQQTASGWDVKLSNGTTAKTDLYISATGVIPNSSFLPKQFLDQEGWVKVSSTNTVEAVSDGSVFALGDVTTHKMRYALRAQAQIPIVAANIKAAIAGGKGSTVYSPSESVMAFVPTGSKSGTGQVAGFVVFSFMVAFVKGRDFFISKAPSMLGM